jgi:hypothetical protein
LLPVRFELRVMRVVRGTPAGGTGAGDQRQEDKSSKHKPNPSLSV